MAYHDFEVFDSCELWHRYSSPFAVFFDLAQTLRLSCSIDSNVLDDRFRFHFRWRFWIYLRRFGLLRTRYSNKNVGGFPFHLSKDAEIKWRKKGGLNHSYLLRRHSWHTGIECSYFTLFPSEFFVKAIKGPPGYLVYGYCQIRPDSWEIVWRLTLIVVRPTDLFRWW